NTSGIAYDKPSITTSWYCCNGAQNLVFLSYVEIAADGDHVIVKRSSDGGQTWDQTADIVTAASLTDPIVMVSAGNGFVYVGWADYSVNPQRIVLARSPSFANIIPQTSWNYDYTGPTGQFVTGFLNDNLLAKTIPSATYNWVANRVEFVWHEYGSDGLHSDIMFASKGTDGWTAKLKLNSENGQCLSPNTDQFMPAVEYDANGNNVITFYDRQLDCTNNYYNYVFVQTDARGNILQSTTVASTFQTDPASDPRPHANY